MPGFEVDFYNPYFFSKILGRSLNHAPTYIGGNLLTCGLA